jgi:molybdate transport system permease protein
MIASFCISLKVLAINIPLLLLFGISIGWILAKKTFPGRTALSLVVLLPVVLPPSVMGLYLLALLGHTPFLKELGIPFTFTAAAIGALLPSLPIMIQSCRTGFAGVPSLLEDTARTLGDSEWRIFFRITLPLARRHLFAGLALASARALGDFGVTLMVAGNMPGRTQTLPLYIYSQVERLHFSTAYLASILLVAAGTASLFFVRRIEEGRHELSS